MPTVEPDDLGRIALASLEIPAARLLDAEPLELDTDVGAAVLRYVADELDDDEVPPSWVLLMKEPDQVVVGGVVDGWEWDPSDDSSEGPWIVVFVVREGSGWSVRGDVLGTRPMPTRRAKGRGLVLEWPAAVLERPSGQFPELHLQLRNASPGIWEDRHGGTLIAFVQLQDPEGGALPGSVRAVTGVGLTHRLQPGEATPVAALVFTDHLADLPPARYRLQASLDCYDLTASAALVLT